MALGLSVATDLTNALLTFYVRGDALSQTTQNKPLLKILTAKAETFPGGTGAVSSPVQGAFMSDRAGFFQGYSEDDELTFQQAANILRVQFDWKEHHSGLIITWTELKKDGITVLPDNQIKEHSKRDLFVLTKVLKNRFQDFSESWARAKNTTLWRDGTQAAKVVAGVTSLLTLSPAVGTTGGLDRATYSWWRHRVKQNILPSGTNQTLCRTLRSEVRQLRRYGDANPDVALCGSDFIIALEQEIEAKGMYTDSGFTKTQDFRMGDVALGSLIFKYDPTLDDLGFSKRCYIFDSRRLRLRPMEGEENRMLDPERPYNYAVFIRSFLTTCTLEVTQLNACGVYSVS